MSKSIARRHAQFNGSEIATHARLVVAARQRRQLRGEAMDGASDDDDDGPSTVDTMTVFGAVVGAVFVVAAVAAVFLYRKRTPASELPRTA